MGLTRFFPILDAIRMPKKPLRRFAKRVKVDITSKVYVANDDLYCGECGDTIPKYSPCYTEFHFANKIGKRGLWSISDVLCMDCAEEVLPMDHTKVKHYEL